MPKMGPSVPMEWNTFCMVINSSLGPPMLPAGSRAKRAGMTHRPAISATMVSMMMISRAFFCRFSFFCR